MPEIPLSQQSEPIAITGISCRFPGGMNTLESFWDVLINKKDVVGEFPKGRINNLEDMVDPGRTPGKIISRSGGFLEKVDEFDAKFFRISPREAEKMDPQQRILLELTYEALEDSGVKIEDAWGSRTAVFTGVWTSDYEHRMLKAGHDIDVYATTGTGRYGASGRISYIFNFQGPCMTLDTACSSSLVAIHLAAQSLLNGESNMAIAAAANLILDSFISVGYSRSGLLAPYGRCRFGSQEPKGYVRSEGAAVVVMKRLSQAIADGDNIYALVTGTSCNSDGQSHKYMHAPSFITQETLIRDAVKRAGISPGEIQYVEAHGTGTKAGDPAELKSIPNAIIDGRDKKDKFYVGSVKTNIGHTEAASGLAALIKTVLAIQHRIIPASLHSTDPQRNPDIPWNEIPLEIPSDNVPWPHPERKLVAGVNSFGISGINAHTIVEEAPLMEIKENTFTHQFLLLPVSAAAEASLRSYVQQYLEDIKAFSKDKLALENWVKNIAFRKSGLAERVIFIGTDAEELGTAMQAFLAGTPNENVLTGLVNTDLPRKTAAVFPGQGSQWPGMGKELYAKEQVFRKAIDDCEQAYHKHVSWKLTEELFKTNGEALGTIDIIQPAIVAIEVATAKLLQSWGLTFDAVIGHSMGEAASAYLSGAISIQEMANIICTRSLLLKKVSGKGAMGYIGLPAEQVEVALKGREHIVSIGVVNSPQSAVISGDPETVDAILKEFEDKGAFCRRVKVDVASHSPQMDPLTAALEAALSGMRPEDGVVKFYSTVLGCATEGSSLDKVYWTNNLRSKVRFGETIQAMLQDGQSVFVECSPHPVLTQPVLENIQSMALEAGVSGTMIREQPEIFCMAKALGAAWCNGSDINWKKYYGPVWKRISLPLYPWQKERYWFDESMSGIGQGNVRKNGSLGHPLLGTLSGNDAGNGIWIWETSIGLQQFPYLAGHKIGESVVFPAAGFLEMMAAAALEALGPGEHCWENIVLRSAFALPEKGADHLQLSMVRRIGEAYDMTISRWDPDGEHGSWNVLVTATLLAINPSGQLLPEAEQWKQKQGDISSSAAHYAATSAMHLPYEGAFMSLRELESDGITIKASIRLEEGTLSTKYILHPALLDGAIQAMLQPMYTLHPERTIVPVQLGKWRQVVWEAGTVGLSIVLQVKKKDPYAIVCDAILLNEKQQLVAEWKDFTLQALDKSGAETGDVKQLLYQTTWHPVDMPEQMPASGCCALFAPDTVTASRWQKAFGANQQAIITILPGDSWAERIDSYTISPSLVQDHHSLWKALQGRDIQQVIYAWPTAADDNDPVSAQTMITLPLLRTIQVFTSAMMQPKLWVITAGSRQISPEEPVHVAAAPVWGMVNVLLNEHPEIRPSRIDLDSNYGQGDVDLAVKAIFSATNENELALRKGVWLAARLENTLPDNTGENTGQLQKAAGRTFEAITAQPGLLDQLTLREKILTDPKENEVQVEITAAGINFMNLMSALGIYPGKEHGFATLGLEFSGVVKKAGAGVKNYAPGDKVMGMGYDTIASHINVDHHKLCLLPKGMATNTAAGIPVVYLTCWYALVHLARLSRGERVLIHAATGGVGLSAIQIARMKGAEIFATAGSEEKRKFLREIGITHVYDSRTLDFYEQILQDTNGEGVDVVLNSLPGEAMSRSMHLLRKYGRFLEIGKKDVYGNSRLGMEAFSRSLSYHMIDLEMLAADKPQLIGEMLQEIKGHFEQGDFSPLPATVFPLSDLKNAFAFMSKSKHTGKIIIDLQEKEQLVEALKSNGLTVRQDATYLLTGGYGGLGLTFAGWLIERGAKHLILTGRSGPKQAAAEQIATWKKDGIDIQIATPDLENSTDLEMLIRSIPPLRPLKGVMHFAGLLDDASVLNITEEQFNKVFGPKVAGAWNLHVLTKDRSLDWWVVPSSSTILFGSPGQAAYVGANSFLDALAEHRRSLGLPAQSIQWGTVAGVGLAAAESNRLDRLAEEGVAPLDTDTCIALYETIVTADQPVTGAFRFDLQRWENTYQTAANNPFFSLLRTTETKVVSVETSYSDFLGTLKDEQERIDHIEERLKEKVGQVVKMDPEKIANKTPFKSLGIDSLMSIQLKNQLEKTFGLTLSVTSFWTHANIRDYTRFLAEVLGAVEEEASPATVMATTPKAMSSDNDMPDMKEFDTDELSRLLEEEMKDL